MLRLIRHRRHWTSHLLLICALAAVVMRAVVPVGYMATRAGDLISVTLCGSGQAAVLDLGDHGPDGKAPGGDGVCVFAASTATAPPLVAASIAAPIVVLDAPLDTFPRAVRIGLGLAAPPPQSHAPPVLV